MASWSEDKRARLIRERLDANLPVTLIRGRGCQEYQVSQLRRLPLAGGYEVRVQRRYFGSSQFWMPLVAFKRIGGRV